MSQPSLSSPYLPHINGLRAFAILGVLFYHLRSDYCPAGYFGVDLFLVISGFLLFRSLRKPGVEQHFNYGSYLLKKAWRILPCWFFVTIAICLVSLYLFPAVRLSDILKTARYSSIALADYYIDLSGDYFNVFSQQNPMLHYWYLSITQQLYLVAPLLVIPLTRWVSRRAANILLLVSGGVSLAFYIISTSSVIVPASVREPLLHSLGMQTAYYHLISRFWEIAIGAAVFLLPELSSHPRLRSCLGLLSLIGIIGAFYLYTTGSPAVYLTVFFSLLALRYGASGLAANLLGCRIVQALGTISFSLYLCHWPVMVFWKYCRFDSPSAWDEVGMMSLSLVLGTICWWGIERIKTPSASGWRGALYRCSLLLVIPLIMVSATKLNKYIRNHADVEEQASERRLNLIAMPEPETDAEHLKGLENLPQLGIEDPVLRVGSAGVQPTFFLLGDSHARHIYDAFNAKCKETGIRGTYISANLAPYWNLNRTANGAWNQQIAEIILRYLHQHDNIRYVIISQYWQYRFTGLYRDSREVNEQLLAEARITTELAQDWRTGLPLTTPKAQLAVTEPGIGEFCDKLRSLGKTVVVLGDNPTFDSPSPMDEWERCQKIRVTYRGRHVTRAEHEARQAIPHRILSSLAEQGRVCYIDLAAALLEDGVYPDRDLDSGQFLYQDNDHLSASGANRAMDYLMPRLLELMQMRE